MKLKQSTFLYLAVVVGHFSNRHLSSSNRHFSKRSLKVQKSSKKMVKYRLISAKIYGVHLLNCLVKKKKIFKLIKRVICKFTYKSAKFSGQGGRNNVKSTTNPIWSKRPESPEHREGKKSLLGMSKKQKSSLLCITLSPTLCTKIVIHICII